MTSVAPDQAKRLLYLGWQCRPGQSLQEGLRAALERYRKRYGRRPAAVLVHRRDGLEAEGMEIIEWPLIPPDCIGLVIEFLSQDERPRVGPGTGGVPPASGHAAQGG